MYTLLRAATTLIYHTDTTRRLHFCACTNHRIAFTARICVGTEHGNGEHFGAFRVGAGPDEDGAADGSSGLVAYVDEAFVYGMALTADELNYLFQAAQVWSGSNHLNTSLPV